MSDKKESANYKDIDFKTAIGKEAIGIDGLDLGKVVETGDTYIVTQRGLIDKKKYYLPVSSLESFDGDLLRLRINDNDLKSYEQTEKNNYEGYSSFKSSDMSGELQTTIPLIDEELDVTKKIVEESVKIMKEPIRKTMNEEIKLSFDYITLIKRPVDPVMNKYENNSNDSITKPQLSSSTDTIGKQVDMKEDGIAKTELIMTLEREEPLVTKRSYVREEIIVKRGTTFETKSITEELIHEQIKKNGDNSV